jgi:hypothetical protein
VSEAVFAKIACEQPFTESNILLIRSKRE